MNEIPKIILFFNFTIKKLDLNRMNLFGIVMSLIFISIPSCDNNSWTTSLKPLNAAKWRTAILNIKYKFHKYFFYLIFIFP